MTLVVMPALPRARIGCQDLTSTVIGVFGRIASQDGLGSPVLYRFLAPCRIELI